MLGQQEVGSWWALHEASLHSLLWPCCCAASAVSCACAASAAPHPAACPATGVQILRRSGTERQKQLAKRIKPVLERPHVLLVTLLVCNALAAEALPLVLDRLADPITAIVVSVTVVLLFGEAPAGWLILVVWGPAG